jgi:uncharacterized protein
MLFKRALITGASSGIGEALARLLAHKGIALILSGRNQKRLEEVAQIVKAEKIIVADLQNTEQRQELVAIIRNTTPDLVVNNAGFGVYGDVLSIPVAEQLAILEVNGAAPLELTLEAARALIHKGKKGVVMNVSSVAGEHPCPGMSVYGGAKSFLTQVSQALNTELSSKGVEILVSCPGMVATDFANRAAKRAIEITKGPILTPQFAAEQIWWQIQKRKEKHIFNWQYSLGSWCATYLAPSSLIRKIIWKRIKQRI